MIRILENQNKINENTAAGSLDALVDSLCQSYSIPLSRIEEMKSGLVEVVSAYLNGFISKVQLSESSDEGAMVIELNDLDKNLQSSVEYIIDVLRLNERVILLQNGSEIIRFENGPDGPTYEITDLDLDLIGTDNLVLAWKCDDPRKVAPLLLDILISRKEC